LRASAASPTVSWPVAVSCDTVEGREPGMSDTSESPDPTELREEIQEELEELTEEAQAEEADRMTERDEQGIDDPS